MLNLSIRTIRLKSSLLVCKRRLKETEQFLLPLLISFGLEEYSVNPADVLRTRAAIAGWSKKDADELAEKVLSLRSENEVREILEKAVDRS